MSINELIDTQIVVYLYNGLLTVMKRNEQLTDLCSNMDKFKYVLKKDTKEKCLRSPTQDLDTVSRRVQTTYSGASASPGSKGLGPFFAY